MGTRRTAVAAFVGLLWPRLPAREPVAIAVVGCYLRLPFLAVVILGAAVVAVLRMV